MNVVTTRIAILLLLCLGTVGSTAYAETFPDVPAAAESIPDDATISADQPAESTSETNEGLKRLLQRYPSADLDANGILSLEEARRFRARLWQEDTEAGEPIERETPDPLETPPVERINAPSFSQNSYGPHRDQYFDLWLPRNAVPPCPAVFCIALDTHKTPAPQTFIEGCLEVGLAFGVIHGRGMNEAETPFEDLDAALHHLYERAVAYGVDGERMGLFAEATQAEPALFAAFLNLREGEPAVGARCAAVIDPLPLVSSEEPIPPESYQEKNYPKLHTLLAGIHNIPAAALLHTEQHTGDLLRQALHLVGAETLLHNATSTERKVHLQRMALMFFQNQLGPTVEERQ